MHYYRAGRIGDQVVEFPWTVGHEFSGVIVEVGDDVEHLSASQRVAVDPLIICQKCDQCLSGHEHLCRNQKFIGSAGQYPGALGEYVVLPGRCCHPVAESMTAQQTALIEPFSIGLYAQRLAGDVAGKSVAILGSGPIGLSVLLSLKAAGACTVYMTDILDYRTELAGQLGADWAGNPQSQDIVAEILRAAPLGVDFAFDCAGEQETIDQCLEVLKPAGTVILVGIPVADRISFDMNIMRRKEVFVQNVRRQNRCVGPAIEMVASGKVDVDKLVTHHFPLAETQSAFDTVANYRDNVVKAMIDIV